MSGRLLARLIAVATGVWLMFAPAVLGYGGTIADDNDRIVGPIAGAFAFVACWTVLDSLRWVQAPLGAWLLVAPLILGYDDTGAWISSLVSGLVFVATAFVGLDRESAHFGGGWTSIAPGAWRRPDR